MSNIAIPVSEGSASYLTSGPKLGLSSHGKTIIGYYASWQWYDRNKLASPENMDFTKVQRVNYAFFQTNTNGDLWGTDSWGDPNVLFGPYDWNPSESSKEFCSWDSPTDRPCNYHKYQQGLIHLVHAAGAELYPSIGGWTLSDAFPAMSANPTARANFAKNCIELIQAYDFDGIDIDWEYPGYEAHSGTPNDRENFRLLLDEVRSALDTFGGQTGRFYGLTAALPCGPSHIANLDIAHVARTLSELNLMTYDFNGAFSPVTGMNSPLYPQGWGEEGFSVHECVQNWLAGGGTKDKINVGLPFYGRSFAGATELNKPHDGADQAVWGIDDGTPQYYNIMAQLPNMNHIWDKRTWTDWAYFTSGGAVSYDSVNAICAKTQYAIENELNGFIIWELSGDVMADLSTPLLDVVNTKLLDPSFSCGETGLYPHEVEASAETDSSPSVITTTQITNDGSENGLPTFPIDTPASPISDQLPSTVNEEQPVFVPAPSPFTDNISTTTDSNPSTVDIVQPTSPTVNDLQPTSTSDFSMVADPTNPGQYQYFIQCQSSYSSTLTPNNLSFRYEMHRHPLASSTEAMKDAKTSMLNDLNKHLGCQNQSSGSIGRNLLNTRAKSVLDYIVGIMSSPMDSEYKEAPCSVPVNLDTASVCDSMVGQLTLFLDPNTPAVLAEEIWRETMFTLRTGMAAGRYETSKVLKTIFIEDTTANQLTESNTNTIPSMTVWNDESESQSKPNIAVTVVCILIVIAILVAQAIFFKKSKSNDTKQAYNNEEISRLGSISCLESIGSGEADVENVWKAALHMYEEETNSKEGVDPEDGYVVTTGSDSSSSQESNTHVETSNEDSEAPNSQDPPADGEDDISAMSDSQDGAVSDLFAMELFELQTELEIHGVDSSNMEKEELVDAILTARRRKRQDVD
jgi:chitinase